VAPLSPTSAPEYAYLQVSIEPKDMSSAEMYPIAFVNGKEFVSSEYYPEQASCGYRFEGLELTEEPLIVALENRVIGCRIEEAQYNYSKSADYDPFMFPSI